MPAIHPKDLFIQHTTTQYPIICGAMYPCSNPELVAAVSAAGGIGIIQPISLTYAHGYSFQEGLDYISSLTDKPLGMNVIVEKSVKFYEKKMRSYVQLALQAGIRFFVTSLGDPRWVCEMVETFTQGSDQPGYVYHDVTEKKWAQKAIHSGVHGLIAVNKRAGGHAGRYSLAELYEQLADFSVPVVAAGGIASHQSVQETLSLGYAGIQLGTRFIASQECNAHPHYKKALVKAQAEDILLSERLTGVPVSVIATDELKAAGGKVSWLGRQLLQNRKTKHMARAFYALRSMRSLPKASQTSSGLYQGYWQAGKSVADIHEILPVKTIISHLMGSL
ncbi:MAG: nitronate monooxygenase [Proteobacteria bacterium]|nr:nitronate monooxygenase [Pseudomonadota bacterium]